MDSLVNYLSAGLHPVQIELRPEKTVAAFKSFIDRGYVHVKFTDTEGGTELGVRVNSERCDFSSADFSRGTGNVKLVGTLTLNSVRVECTADVALESLSGQGQLAPAAEESAPN